MMGTPGNRSTEPGLQGLQNRKAARQWAAFFAITLPRQSSTIKKIRKPPYSSGGALGFHRNGPTMRGRALDCCRNRGRAGTNPGTPERPSETGTAASHNAILFPGSDLHRPPGCFRDTPHPAPAVLWDRFFIPPLFSGRFYCYFDNK